MSVASITILRDQVAKPAGLVWEDPPAKDSKPGRYAAIAAALRERPNSWAVIRTYPADQGKKGWGFASSIRNGKYLDFRHGFEASARTVDGQVRVYVRYVGEGADR
ncbi:hypothetical protein [Nocardioides speluncae]|uniref:hypothetical protein n=1 Tax=Nocardioides speluncae TaxID=2670337 RepID=UPI000D6948B9|nr:hypothetical protein [Nocardioides speluncae]